VCTGGAWTTTKSACAMSTTCGSTPPTSGTACPTNGVACAYGSTICICSQCPSGLCMAGGPDWSCAGPPSTAGCPPLVPNQGTACSTADLMCTYGFPCGGSGTTAVCKGGLWSWVGVACPG
jgi:hypothetical protein